MEVLAKVRWKNITLEPKRGNHLVNLQKGLQNIFQCFQHQRKYNTYVFRHFSEFHENYLHGLSSVGKAELLQRVEKEFQNSTSEWKEILFAIDDGGERLDAYLDKFSSTADRVDYPLYILGRLDSEEQFVKHYERQNARSMGLTELQIYLAATEWRGLHRVPRYLDHLNSEIINLEIPEVAPFALRLLYSYNPPRDGALMWMRLYPVCAFLGLMDLKSGPDTGDAYYFMRMLYYEGLNLDRLREYLTAEQQAWLVAQVKKWDKSNAPVELNPQLKKLLDKAKPWKPVSFIKPEHLPKIISKGRAFTTDEVVKILGELRRSTLDKGSPLLSELKGCCEPESLNDFVNALRMEWSLAKYPSEHKWPMTGFLHLACSVQGLADLVLRWEVPGLQAVYAMKCLHKIGNREALKALLQINKDGRRTLRKRAEQLYDDLVHVGIPDCGMDERGGWDLDYGGRIVRVVLDNWYRIAILNGNEISTRLPLFKKGDDREKVAVAKNRFKAISKEISQIIQQQIESFERYMTCAQRWSHDEFEKLFSSPLIKRLTRSIILGVYDNNNHQVNTFRVMDDDFTFSDSHNEKYVIPTNSSIGVAHPIEISEEEKGRWTQLANDYRLVPLFKQLNRRYYLVTDNDKEKGIIVHDPEKIKDRESTYRALKNHKFLQRAEDRWIRFYSEYNITVVLYIDCRERYPKQQKVFQIYFLEGRVAVPSDYKKFAKWNEPDPMQLKTVHPILYSEMMWLAEQMSPL